MALGSNPRLPPAFNSMSSTKAKFSRVIGDSKNCINVFEISNEWRKLDRKDLALLRRETAMVEFSVPSSDSRGDKDICGHLSLKTLRPAADDMYHVSENAVLGKIYFNSTDPQCGGREAPPRSRLTIVSRSLIDSISNDSVLPGVNVEKLQSVFGSKLSNARLFLFYRNNDVTGDLKNCGYIDGTNPPADLFPDGAGRSLFYREELRKMNPPRVPALELIIEGLMFGQKKNGGKEKSGLDESHPGSMSMSASSSSGDEKSNASPTSQQTSDRSQSNSCFPSDATVELMDGTSVKMSELSIGDQVKVGANKYSDVFMFTHKTEDSINRFVTLRTKSGALLSLSGGHFIYNDNTLVAAADVRVGSSVLLGSGEQDFVVSISTTTSSGLYNPQTVSGDIVVNNILTSTYTVSIEPRVAHILLAPLRLAYRILGFTTSTLEGGAKGFEPLVRLFQSFFSPYQAQAICPSS